MFSDIKLSFFKKLKKSINVTNVKRTEKNLIQEKFMYTFFCNMKFVDLFIS